MGDEALVRDRRNASSPRSASPALGAERNPSVTRQGFRSFKLVTKNTGGQRDEAQA